MPDIQLLTLDLDNTLWDVDAIIIKAEQDLRSWLTANAPESMAFYTQEHLPEFRKAVVDTHPSMVHDLSFMRIEVLNQVMLAAGFEEIESRSLAEGAFEVFFEGRNRVQFFPGALESLETLSQRYTMYALTNGNADIERAGLGHLLDGAISSADVGKSKPSKEMFHAPLEKLGLNPEQTIHIGDNPIDDIQGAHAIGMHTIWVNLNQASLSEDAVQPHQEIAHLDELVDAIDRIHS